MGIERTAPVAPAILKPIIRARMLTNGLTPVVFSMILGTRRLFSACWTNIYKARVAKAVRGCIVKATIMAGTAEIVGPMLYLFSRRRRHTGLTCDWSSDVCSSDLSMHCGEEEYKALHIFLLKPRENFP